MTDENVKQLASLKFDGEVEVERLGSRRITWNDLNPLALSISADGKIARIYGGGGNNRRKYDFKQPITVTDGKIALQWYRNLRMFTVYRNSGGKFRLSTRFDFENRNGFFDVRIVFTQE